jgi:methyltransferase-like protein
MYAGFLDGKLEEARPRSDALLLHDELEEINEPVYFYQFAERAEQHGLQYLADFHHRGGGELSPEVSQKLRGMAQTHIDLEQYLDFVQNRTFRQTLLCHKGIEPDRSIGPDRVMGFYIASRAQSEEHDPDIHSVSVTKFRGHDGAVLSTDHPVTKAAMLCLAEIWPRSSSFGDLLSAARSRLGQGPALNRAADDIDVQVLGANLLSAYGYSESLVELHVHAPNIVLHPGERPVASAVVRLQAQDSDRVTNLRHERVTLDGFDRYLLQHLDGSRDRKALVDLLLRGPVAEGILTVQQDGQRVKDMRGLLAEELETRLAWLARAGLFVHPWA